MMKSGYCAVRTGTFKYSSWHLVYDENCLLRVMDWVLKYSSWRLIYDESDLLRGTNWVF
jgi:hypothetical protein